MKASVYYGKNDIRYQEMPVPDIEDGDILVRMKSCGLCGTDIHKARHQTVTGPVVLGHEVAAEVVKVGARVSRFRPGDRVVTAIHVPCFSCHYCHREHFTLCEQFKPTHIEPGGFAEYIRLPELHVKHLTHLIPEGVSWDNAAMVEPIGCCLHGLKQAAITPGCSVLVMGSGTIGLLSAQLAAMMGASTVMVSDLSPFKLDLALRLGIDHAINPAKENLPARIAEITAGLGVDVVVIAAGVASLLPQAIDLLRRGGRVVVFSPFDQDNLVTIDAARFFRDEISIVGTYSLSSREMQEAVEIIRNDRIRLGEMITHSWPLSRLHEAIEFAANPHNEVLKVIMQMDE
ncbi:zinc-binding dehydrogenase [Erwinia mallotivora]|uniref:L-iditol 2-dehydrogenase n=1 Tax=Erwinia mallotivora TaxID=69222 RepID=A0A014N3E5_9GAMM|nr:zinc-binding dehydrogenase [Erwinia mallotivora]EXU73923.1 L-iditol 2-dehydrogenase [Erwinia mallotivora]